MAAKHGGEGWRVLARSGAALQGLESRLMEHGKLGPPIHLRVGCVGVWLDWCDLTGGGLSLGGHWPAPRGGDASQWILGCGRCNPTTTSHGAWNGRWALADGPGRRAHGNYGALDVLGPVYPRYNLAEARMFLGEVRYLGSVCWW